MTDQREINPPALTLLFEPGHRPDSAEITRLAAAPAQTTMFSVSYRPEDDESWVELLAMGLTYDLSGLAPARAEHAPVIGHRYGLDSDFTAAGLEGLRIVPGRHIAEGRVMPPVIRMMAGLGAELSRLPNLRAVCWETAHSAMAPAYFANAVRGWLLGGAFPSLGLTALRRMQDGTMVSEGLALFAGYEVAVAAVDGEAAAETARFATRVIHQLVLAGAESLVALSDPPGPQLNLEFNRDRTVLYARRSA